MIAALPEIPRRADLHCYQQCVRIVRHWAIGSRWIENLESVTAGTSNGRLAVSPAKHCIRINTSSERFLRQSERFNGESLELFGPVMTGEVGSSEL